MGEAWSDFYAMDFLVSHGLEGDGRRRRREPRRVRRPAAARTILRTEPIDCTRRPTSGPCSGGLGTGPGGYTYGDFGHIYGVPEVHGDGEIWVQTLWDLREALGSDTTLIARHAGDGAVAGRAVVPRHAQRDHRRPTGSPSAARTPTPSGRCSPSAAWASSRSRSTAADTTPVEDFSMPPVCPGDLRLDRRPRHSTARRATRSRRARSRSPVTRRGSSATSPPRRTRAGASRSPSVPYHAYAMLVVDAEGVRDMLAARRRVDGDETRRLRLRRDWAALDGGARLVSASRPDYSDVRLRSERSRSTARSATGWGSDAPGNDAAARTGRGRRRAARRDRATSRRSGSRPTGRAATDRRRGGEDVHDLHADDRRPWVARVRQQPMLERACCTRSVPTAARSACGT